MYFLLFAFMLIDTGLDLRMHEVHTIPDLLLPLLFIYLHLCVVLVLFDLVLHERAIRVHKSEGPPTELEFHGEETELPDVHIFAIGCTTANEKRHFEFKYITFFM